MVKRGEIWLAVLDPTIGSEIRKTRPCLVISPAEIHDHLRTVIVAPMTSGSRPAPYRVALRFRDIDGFVLTEQIRVLDKARLVKRLGSVPASVLSQVLRIVRETYEE
ncbi:type II toxin-antitoxin system PemK/MazF family toxin [Bosea sp. (in: a-proteobacteria)]|uniref:type II toxin-antitoxin system PemK/MazF family toxin n=1 Tax=Bosea sp. (in: a-proteobacteria) TaxID=1871050 RepID=UPI002FCA6BE7